MEKILEDKITGKIIQLLSDASGKSISSIDISKLPDIARYYKVSSILHNALKKRKNIKTEVLNKLREDWQNGIGQYMLTEMACKKFDSIMQSESIEYIPFKGALFRQMLYFDPSTRPAADIDILLRPGQLEKGVKTLINAGYIKITNWPEHRKVSENTYFEEMLAHPEINKPGTLIDLHQAFTRSWRYPVDYKAIWSRSLSLKEIKKRSNIKIKDLAFGECARFMSPEDMLVHLFIHNASHSFYISLFTFIDIKLLVEMFNINWDLVIKMTKDYYAASAGYFTLKIAESYFGVEVPDEVMRSLKPKTARDMWLSLFIKKVPKKHINAMSDFNKIFVTTKNIKHQQIMVTLPLIDGIYQPLRFIIYYFGLRVCDYTYKQFDRLGYKDIKRYTECFK